MLKEWKNKRQLSLLIAFALSAGGGQLFFNHAHAADVTGGDVVYDVGNPSYPVPPAIVSGGTIASASDNGTVTGNTLTLNGITINGQNFYGGYTAGTGNATGNKVYLENLTIANNTYIYGGWASQGSATGNRIILKKTNPGALYHLVLSGGGNYPSGDQVTGNVLEVATKDNFVHTVNKFEKMQFDLGTGVVSGDTMLTVGYYTQPFDWNKISVDGAATWMTSATGSSKVTLYKGAVALNNYLVTNATDVDFEYGIRSNTATPMSVTPTNVTASEIYFERNKFKNAIVEYTTPLLAGEPYYAGTSTLGNTTKDNTLTLKNMSVGVTNNDKVYGGFTQFEIGNSTGNKVYLENLTVANNTYVYGGWAKQGSATGNRIILKKTNPGALYHLVLSGGGDYTSGDQVTGNVLEVATKDNFVHTVNKFEKMQFDLGTGVVSGDTMLTVGYYNTQQFDWNKISVKGVTSWEPALSASDGNIPTLTLYTGAPFTLTNYTPALIGTAGNYEFGKKANTSAVGTVGVSVLSLDGNRFQNATNTPTTWAADVHAGISTYGNTTNHNILQRQHGPHKRTCGLHQGTQWRFRE